MGPILAYKNPLNSRKFLFEINLEEIGGVEYHAISTSAGIMPFRFSSEWFYPSNVCDYQVPSCIASARPRL